jgi:ribosomal protein S18 acetylase RimI-like enzyme
MGETEIQIRHIDRENRGEAASAARLMSSTEPWITLGRKFEHTIVGVTNPNFEVYLALAAGEVVGVVMIAIHVPLIRGYIAGLAVHRDWRNRGVGTQLMRYAEDRILRDSPNVFLCVSSFNPNARRFYERLGFTQCGELTDLVVAGHSEVLMRKTTGPWSTFVPKK